MNKYVKQLLSLCAGVRHAWIIIVKECFRVGSGVSSAQKAGGGGGGAL